MRGRGWIAGITLVLGAWIAQPASAQTTQVGLGAFGSGSVVESFEGLSIGPNSPEASDGYLLVGAETPFTFGTGVTFLAPVPNATISRGVFVADFAHGSVSHGFSPGTLDSAGEVPTGTAFFGFNKNTGLGGAEFTFASDVKRVGGVVTAHDSGPIVMEAYDASNTLLGSASVSPVALENWSTNFLGIQNLSGIRKIRIDGAFMVMDDLRFEPLAEAPAVPEPGALALFLPALGAVALARKKRTS